MHFIPEKKKLFSYARGGQVLNLKGKDSNILIANCICSSEMALRCWKIRVPSLAKESLSIRWELIIEVTVK